MKRPPAVTAIDFETLPIVRGAAEPVGVSIRKPGDKRSRYYAWGHPTGNNCDKATARGALLDVWNNRGPLLFHNAKYDVDVAQTFMGMGPIAWDRVHDTMFLLFLHDPHGKKHDLKSAAEEWLDWPPEERDRLKEWLVAHKADILQRYKLKITAAGKGENAWGKAIAYAPGDVVAPYACGDTDRTLGLFRYLYPLIAEADMEGAYDRERELMPILLENERVGLRCDLQKLQQDIGHYSVALEKVDVWLRKRLKAPSLSLDNDGDVAEALSSAGIVDDDAWTLTPTGKRSVSKKNLLPEMYNDPRVASAFGYRNRLQTCLKMFMVPWAEQAQSRADQHVSTNWNQTRGEGGGTRTGRPSTSDPNFLNISKTWHDKNDFYVHPKHIVVPELPLVRSYLLADKDAMFCHRDYSGQELRVLAHYEEGDLFQAYVENPRLDPHLFVRDMIEEIAGLKYERTPVKVTNFRIVYGGGVPATMDALHISYEAAKQLLDAHAKAMPGIKELKDTIKKLSNAGVPIVTWGGRVYFVEPPGFNKKHKRHMTYEYKLINYLVQGSAADATKQAIINYHNHPKRNGRFLVTVYDEINTSSAAAKSEKARLAAADHEMRVLRESMECLDFDVPMLSDAKIGTSWGNAVKYKEAA